MRGQERHDDGPFAASMERLAGLFGLRCPFAIGERGHDTHKRAFVPASSTDPRGATTRTCRDCLASPLNEAGELRPGQLVPVGCGEER